MTRVHALSIVLVLGFTACGDGDTSPTTTQASSPTTEAGEAPTTTAPTTTTTTTAEATTTTAAEAALPQDACERIDIDALQEALGVVNVRAGSPFRTDAAGITAQCRYGVTYEGSLGTGFTINMYGPGFPGAFDDRLELLDPGETTEVADLGVRALFFAAAGFNDAATLLVEFDGGWVVYAQADNDAAYVANPPADALRIIIGDLVAPIFEDT